MKNKGNYSAVGNLLNKQKQRSLVLPFLAGNFFHFAIYVSFGNELVEAYFHRSSLTVMLLHSQGFWLCYTRLDSSQSLH